MPLFTIWCDHGEDRGGDLIDSENEKTSAFAEAWLAHSSREDRIAYRLPASGDPKGEGNITI